MKIKKEFKINPFSTKKLKFMAALFVCFSLLAIAMVPITQKGLDATQNTDSTSYVMVDEIWNSDTEQFNASSLSSLLQYITGDEDITASDITTQGSLGDMLATNSSYAANGALTSADIRDTQLAAGNTYTNDSSEVVGQDVQVTFGGLTWQVVHLTQDRSGNDIVTLWLSNNYQEAWEGREANEGEHYGFIDGALYSDWSNNFNNSSFTVTYPSSLYGASYIHAVTLNNGGTYATSTSAVTSQPAQQDSNSVFALFTMEEVAGNVTEYLVTPSEVAYQETENVNTQFGFADYYPNEAYGEPNGSGSWSPSNGGAVNITTNQYYDAWADDTLWLPSLTETGYDTGYEGLWDTSTAQRAINTGSTSNTNMGKVGTASGTAYGRSWLRSGSYTLAYYAYILPASGSGYSYNTVSTSYAVRPALHLNLNSAALSTTKVNVDEIWNEEGGYFDEENLNTLLQYVTGSSTITASDVASTKINQTRTSADIRTTAVNSKTNTQDVQVTFGGLTWNVTYLSQDTNGNDIVTLWLSNNYQEAWEGRPTDEGTYYGFIDGALYSDWSYNLLNYYYQINYPTNMYGISYINAVTLNNGGSYVTSVSGNTSTSTATLTSNVGQNSNSVFAIYTMDSVAGNVTDYLVKPNEVSWQKTENAYAQGCSYTYGNDAWGTPAGSTKWYTSSTYGSASTLSSKGHYTDWANNYIWLPSMAEAGNGTDGTGLWEVSTYQRQNNSGTDDQINTSVGSSNSNNETYARDRSWLRSGTYGYASNACYLGASGSGYSNSYVTYSNAVRPALHLNLTAAAKNAVAVTSPTWDGSTTAAPSLEDPTQPNSEDNPYIIDSAAKLAWISANFDQPNCYGQHYLQTVNIDLASHPWTPINNASSRRAYFYDGGGHTISNLYINTAEQTLESNNYLGLFGYVFGSSSNHAYIKNLGIVNGSIAGESSRYVGAVVGYAHYTDITNCYNEKTDITMTGSSNSVGGVAGDNNYGTISSSYNTGTVSGNNSVGGVAGDNNYGTISSSYNTGTVSGSWYVGGVAGINYGTISGSYNTGTVTGSGNSVGGVAGNNSGTISGSYNTGAVSSRVGSVGGVVGVNYGTISNSYNTGIVSGNSHVGGVVGNNSGIISSSYNTGTVSGYSTVGGVVGGNYGTISGSYNTGTVTGSGNSVGGVVGYVRGSSSSPAVISSCFSTGAVTRTSGSSTSFGGVVGDIDNSTNYPSQYVSISWCYYNTETVGSVVTKAIGYGKGYQCYGLTTAQMQGDKNQNYMYLSDTVWNFASGQYPTLKYVATAQN